VVVEDTRRRSPTFGVRFQAYGKRRYVTLGSREDGMDRAKAERELGHILADVQRGIWQPVTAEPVEAPREVPTFHVFASEWFERQKVEGGRRGGGLTAAGVADLEWRLANHLVWFNPKRLDAITVADVDAYRLAKVRAGKLNATSINKTLQVLSAILEAAGEYGYVSRNVAHGRRRRLPSITPSRTTLDRAEHIAALLDAAGALDNAARCRHGQRRALVAALVFAGLRIGEALALRWSDVDLERGTINVRTSKTDAGVRTVNIVPILGAELAGYGERANGEPDALVFGSSNGRAQSPSNIRRRMLAKAVENANEKLEKSKVSPMPSLTPHSLRRTFASLLFAIGEAPPYVMAQMGHTTAELTLSVYAREMARRDGEPERLRALVEGANWQRIGSSGNVVELADRTRQTA
jgi:integrase